jgi:hypothetical protein
MRGVDARDARRNGVRFDGLVNGGKNNDVARDVDNHAAAGKVGDDFIVAILGSNGSSSGEDG